MDNEKDDVIVRLNWLSQNFANKKKLWVKRSKKDFADKAFSICTDAFGLLIEQKAEIERLKEMQQVDNCERCRFKDKCLTGRQLDR